MPRPKVAPDARQRSVIACVPCKSAKIRCDSKTPCSTCVRRSRQDQCLYQEPTHDPSSRRRRRSTLSKAASSTTNETAKEQEALAHDDTRPTPESIADGDLSTNDESQGPKSRMLLSSKFQKVYIGATASLSYLQFVRRIVQHRIGPNPFTDGDFNAFMLESNVDTESPEIPLTLTQEDKKALAQSYLDGTSGILDFGAKAEIFDAAVNIESADIHIGPASAYLILAIGAQCRGLPPSDRQNAATLFSQGQQLAFQDMLRDPTLDMVRSFLLMAFYMLGACHRNAAFMYLGVAAKAASALGLHRAEQYRDMPPDECRSRISTWKSLRVLDTIYNSILGRTGSLPGAFDEPRLRRISLSCGDHDGSRQLALGAAFDLCPFMDELEQKHCIQDTSAAEGFLQRLQQWSKALPQELRRSTEIVSPSSMTTDRELFTGGTQVACAYYFMIILTTRKFLTLYLLDQLSKRSTNGSGASSNIDDKTTSLAFVCINAAVSLTKVAYNAIISEHVLNNMCLLKAWVFAAGLLLGFTAFAQENTSGKETEEAFSQSRAVLEKLGQLSPQAGHYLDILSSLSNAINLYQQKISDDRRKMTSQYMDQIFTTGTSKTPDVPDLSSSVDSALNDPPTGLDSWNTLEGLDAGSLAEYNMTSGPYGTMISEGFPWPADDFGIDWQTYAPFLGDVL